MNKDSYLLSEGGFRAVAGWMIFAGTATFSAVFLAFVVYHSWGDDSWIIDIVKAHFAATIGLPLAAIASICVVLIFKYATGPIEFKVLGVEFRGASGPVVLWIFCFLAIAVAIALLW